MGASLSTLGGWVIVFSIAGYYAFSYLDGNKKRELAKAAAQQKKRIEDRYVPEKKEAKNKAKRQRGESLVKEEKAADKAAKAKQRPTSQQPLSTTTNKKQADYSSDDDGVDNREFAKQLASIKQGTSFAAPKKEEKKSKSVKQSRALEADNTPKPAKVPAPSSTKVSAPSSTTGADADDDQSSNASPEFTPVDSRDVSDMLEQPSSSGPSVLRLTDTDKAAKPNKKTKAPEVKETKKQRQNRAKVEAAKLAREAEEAERKVKAEEQRRTARIAEGRPAKDGSTFTNAAAPKSNVWTASNGANGANGTSSEFVPVQPLDTFTTSDTASKTDTIKASSPSHNWVATLPSEEEQLSLLKDEDNWNTVTKKKAKQSKTKKEAVTSDDNSNDQSSVTSSVQKPLKATPAVQQPVVTPTQQPTRASGRPSTFAQKSSFAALTNDDEEQEQEWDV
ncbi:hypothetical protein GE09DRAFT_1125925 [Coniochaeta sp. 2T2.1]|nr:hypothetical protein GE09DRAFT_1125925 [Coniochaeta sp. 2T2.1]